MELKNNTGVNVNDLENIGIDYERFHCLKSYINANKNKYKNIQIIKNGTHGNSNWKLAQIDTEATMKYCRKRTRKAVKNITNMNESLLITLVNEKSKKVRKKIVATISNCNQLIIEKSSV